MTPANICDTCGLSVRHMEKHKTACLSWRAAIERGETHDLIARYWDAATAAGR